MPQTIVEYNGVTIKHCLTKTFRQESMFDESDTDLLYYKFTIRVVGYVHGNTGTEIGIDPIDGTNAAAQHISVRSLLMAPRGDFDMSMGGATILSASLSGSSSSGIESVDLNNGPYGKVFDITHVSGNEIFRVEAEFEVCVLECEGTESVPNTTGVLSNRWSVSDDIDQNYMTTRTFTGRLRVASSVTNANDFRNLVVPPLVGGMRRDRMTFLVTEDGLTLEYTVVDKEVAYSAPPPATSWSYRHRESTGDAKTVLSEVNVTLGGDRNTPKGELILLGVAICEAKLIRHSAAGKALQTIDDFSITDEYGDNVNRVHVSCRITRQIADIDTLHGIVSRDLGKPITGDDLVNAGAQGGYDSNLSRGANPDDQTEFSGALSMVAAFSTALQDPCKEPHEFLKVSIAAKDLSSESQPSSTRISTRVVGTLPATDSASYISEAHKEAIYTHWKMESVYRTSANKVQLPIASGSEGSSGSDGGKTSVVVSLSQPVTQRVIRISGQRMGKEPQLPEPKEFYDFNGGVAELLEATARIQVPDRDVEGKLIFSIEAEYVYAISNPPRVNTPLPIGSNPWEAFSVSRHTTEDDTFLGALV